MPDIFAPIPFAIPSPVGSPPQVNDVQTEDIGQPIAGDTNAAQNLLNFASSTATSTVGAGGNMSLINIYTVPAGKAFILTVAVAQLWKNPSTFPVTLWIEWNGTQQVIATLTALNQQWDYLARTQLSVPAGATIAFKGTFPAYAGGLNAGVQYQISGYLQDAVAGGATAAAQPVQIISDDLG